MKKNEIYEFPVRNQPLGKWSDMILSQSQEEKESFGNLLAKKIMRDIADSINTQE